LQFCNLLFLSFAVTFATGALFATTTSYFNGRKFTAACISVMTATFNVALNTNISFHISLLFIYCERKITFYTILVLTFFTI
jgi:hypothetical protein